MLTESLLDQQGLFLQCHPAAQQTYEGCSLPGFLPKLLAAWLSSRWTGSSPAHQVSSKTKAAFAFPINKMPVSVAQEGHIARSKNVLWLSMIYGPTITLQFNLWTLHLSLVYREAVNLCFYTALAGRNLWLRMAKRDQAQPYKENQIFNSSFQDKSSSHALGADTETAKKETTGICEGTRVSELLQQKPPLARQISSTIHGLPRSDPQLQSGARSISHTEQ